jgi:hypothetical protein
MSRPYLLLSVCVLISAMSVPASAGNKDKQAAATARPYVETSYLVAPRQVGEFELEGSSFDPKQKFSGAGFRYAVKGHQEIRIDIYVYPAGRMSQNAAMESGVKGFRDGLALAVEQGTYSQLRELHQAPFPLAPPDSASKTPANDVDAQVIKAIADAEQITGQKLQMSLNLMPRNWSMYSNGYLFYKQLYYFKLRASAAQERITTEQFNAVTDLAAHTLIPALQVANVGDCANSTIYLAPDATPEQNALALVSQASVHEGYNCHGSVEKAGIAARRDDSEIVEISFTADEWKSQ